MCRSKIHVCACGPWQPPTTSSSPEHLLQPNGGGQAVPHTNGHATQRQQAEQRRALRGGGERGWDDERCVYWWGGAWGFWANAEKAKMGEVLPVLQYVWRLNTHAVGNLPLPPPNTHIHTTQNCSHQPAEGPGTPSWPQHLLPSASPPPPPGEETSPSLPPPPPRNKPAPPPPSPLLR